MKPIASAVFQPLATHIGFLVMPKRDSSPAIAIDPLDRAVYGASAIAAVLNMVDHKSQSNARRAYHYLQMRLIDADKMGEGKKSQ
jgi:hypothetical protein